MRITSQLDYLETLADQIGIRITYEKLRQGEEIAGSGLCRLYGRYRLLIDQDLSDEQKVEIMIAILSRFDLEHIHVLPRIRERIERYRRTQACPSPEESP